MKSVSAGSPVSSQMAIYGRVRWHLGSELACGLCPSQMADRVVKMLELVGMPGAGLDPEEALVMYYS